MRHPYGSCGRPASELSGLHARRVMPLSSDEIYIALRYALRKRLHHMVNDKSCIMTARQLLDV